MKSTSQTVENAVGDDIELNLACSTIVKSTESTTAMDTSGKSDARDTSGASVDKKSVKKKKKKTKPSPSPSPQKKMKKDPNKPDYPKVGYVRFMNVRRDELRKEHPDMHHLDVTKKIGEEWMSMCDEKKQPYLDAAKQDKIRYKIEMKAYNKKLFDLQKKADQGGSTKSNGKKKPLKPVKDANTSESAIEDSPKKKKRKIDKTKTITVENEPNKSTPASSRPTKPKSTSGTAANQTAKKTPPKQFQSTALSSSSSSAPTPTTVTATAAAATAVAAAAASVINTPPPTPPRIDVNGVPIFGDIPIFTEKFLEHNRQMETELKKIRKLNSDYEQQNAVLEKHVENVRAGIDKTNDDITELRKENERLSAYMEALRSKLAAQLRNLAIPSEPNGANIDNIDKYMNDLYEMVQDNSHGPASLNKAKDLLRKVDLNIDLQNVKISN